MVVYSFGQIRRSCSSAICGTANWCDQRKQVDMPDLPHLMMLQCDIEVIMAAVDPCTEQCDDV
jgi:hypothetical protein